MIPNSPPLRPAEDVSREQPQGKRLEETHERLQEAIRLVFEANRELTGMDQQ
jgi:predicted RNase H-like HicB family nuclease